MAVEKPARDTAAVEPADWLARHGDALYRYAYYRVFDAGAAEDLVQETLLADGGAHLLIIRPALEVSIEAISAGDFALD